MASRADGQAAKVSLMATALPICQIGKKCYFVDERLQELRNVRNPNDVESIELWYEAQRLDQKNEGD